MGDLRFSPSPWGSRCSSTALFDIDHVINRTLVYGGLTLVLAIVYVDGVVGVGNILRVLTGQQNNPLVVAASTLAVAAMFRPARASIQSFIDRSF